MDWNVSVFKRIKGLTPFRRSQKFVLSLFVVAPFSAIIANYSPYYIWKMDILASIFAIIFFLFLGGNLSCNKYKPIVLKYFIVSIVAWGSPLLFHFQAPYVKVIVQLIFACVFLLLRDDAKTWVYDKFIKLLAILFFLSIIEFLFAQIGKVYIIGTTIRPNSDIPGHFYQTIFNILPHYYSNGTARFQSITEEPGLVGTLCFFIISSIDMKKYKFQTIVFGVAGILSMSLAFYVLISIWLIFKLKSLSFKFIFLVSLFLGTICFTFQDRLNNIIINRITEQQVEGKSLNNRYSEEVNRLFDETFNSFEKIICGIGNRTFEQLDTGNSAGIKKNIVQYGFCMVFIGIIAFCNLYLKFRGYSYNSKIVLILFLISLYQRFEINLCTNIIVIFGSMLPLENTIKYYK